MLFVKKYSNKKIIIINGAHKNRVKMEVMSKINEMKRVLHKHRNMKKVLLLWFRNAYVK